MIEFIHFIAVISIATIMLNFIEHVDKEVALVLAIGLSFLLAFYGYSLTLI